MEEIINKIKTDIDSSTKNTLFKNKSSRYYRDFLDKVTLIANDSMQNTKQKLKSLKLKLQLTDNFNQFTYYQGISEMMLWMFCLEKNLKFSLEKKLSSENNRDVDVQIVEKSYTFNIEVKCPEFELSDKSILNIQNAFRTIPKEQADVAVNEFKNFLTDRLDNKKTPYNGIEISKINDNKLVDYLKSGQEKFSDNGDSTLNILMVAVRSTDLQTYWQYLYNAYSGLFTSNSFCNNDEYSKVDIVLLTNIIEGHENPSEEYNSWEIKNYCNLICLNPFNIKDGELSEKYKSFLDMFPNSKVQFEEYYKKFKEAIKNKPVPDLELLLFPHYMYDYHPLQWKK